MIGAHAIMARHSKSFFLAARLLPARTRLEAAVVYAYCRRADDAVDLIYQRQLQRERLRAMFAELDAIYGRRRIHDPLVAAFQEVTLRRQIPRHYPEELLRGIQMDVQGMRYETLSDLELYCFRVAGTVGLMMCHLMGVRRPRALRRAVHLGIAMQLTNICRDVREDWHRDRLYLPRTMLRDAGAPWLGEALGQTIPTVARGPIARVVRRLLDRAEGYYRSADRGIGELSWRCALAVGAARRIYARIGHDLRARRCDPLDGRVVVGHGRKLMLMLQAAAIAALALPSSMARPSVPPLTLALSRDLFLPGDR